MLHKLLADERRRPARDVHLKAVLRLSDRITGAGYHIKNYVANKYPRAAG